MAITRLQLYNIACMAVKERTLATPTEDREPRRLLDEVWTRGNGAVRYGLEQGLWNHAMRAVQIDKSASVTPEFGFSYAFDKPTDFVRLATISADENFSFPLQRYEFEGAYIYADVDPLYVRYVSDDTSWGADFSLWPETFSLWFGHWLATQIGPRVAAMTGDDLDRLEKRTNKLLIDARSKDASQEPTRYPPLSSWNRARFGGRGGERGKRNQLIG